MSFGFARAKLAESGTAHQFTFLDMNGDILDMADFAGKTVLVVNTASRCGFTKQYAGLQKLYEDYQSRGLVILGVPSNDFGKQEPGTDSEIGQFCESSFGVTFPLTIKTKVTGEAAHPFYAWAARQVSALGRPRWNFNKYLISPQGELADWVSSMTGPEDTKLRAAVERWLPLQTPEPLGKERIPA